MAKTARLKGRRQAEQNKVDLAVKYARRGVATGGGRVTPKKVRHALEARFVPVFVKPTKRGKKAKPGRRHNPPSNANKTRRAVA